MNRRPLAAGLALAASLTLALSGCGHEVAPTTAAATGATLVPSLHDRLPAKVKESGVLRVATDASYAPASFFGTDGHQIIGFEPDLAKALGETLGVRFEFTNVDFSKIIAMVVNDETDLGISAMTDTKEREKDVDFVSYFSAGTSIVVQRGNPHGVTDVKDLCGKEVAVEEGTVQVDLLARAQANCLGSTITVDQYPQNSDALLQLRTGRVAAVLNDFPPASYLVNAPRTKAHYQLASTVQYEPGLYGIAVNKQDTALRDVLKDALDELIRSGRYTAVLDDWDVDGGAVKSSEVNAAS
ncbi:MAG TPA: ABC transporter substrate-binding protein [Actinomycetales bacterium]|nr:ABC transporter substrate-binding protein [Actinomycetales bacterium]